MNIFHAQGAMNGPYDPMKWYYKLIWDRFCSEATPSAFEQMFQDVMKAHDSDFVAVRPYGNSGDKKNDGMLFAAGTVYQVYSPDTIKQATLVKKIKADFNGAVAHWGKNGLKKWVFVYNTRRGLAPDVPAALKSVAKSKKYVVELLEEADIWGILRGLSPQVLAELLGPPPQGVTFSTAGPASPVQRTEERVVVIHDVLSKISFEDTAAALPPETPYPVAVYIRPHCGDGLWESAAAAQERVVADLLHHSEELSPRFSLFSISPIPLVVHLGFRFSDRVPVRLHQYHRDRMTWRWDTAETPESSGALTVSGLPESGSSATGDIALVVSLSDIVDSAAVAAVLQSPLAMISIQASNPDRLWLQHEQQLVEFTQTFRDVLKRIGQLFSNASCIHLFAAAPTPACFAMGQCINPRMSPPVALYQYERQRLPRYQRVLTLSREAFSADLSEFHYTAPSRE